jgi:hypothetical protein
MDIIGIVFVLALTVEALVEYAKLIFVEHTINWKQIVALVLGVGLAIFAEVDIYQWLGIEFSVPYVGFALTGIMFSRGSNWLADFIKKIQLGKPTDPEIPVGDDPK